MSPAQREARLVRLEAALAVVVARVPPGFDFERHLSFGELLAADAIATRYASPATAVAAGDPAMIALLGAAAARFAGVEVAELFPEPAASRYGPVT